MDEIKGTIVCCLHKYDTVYLTCSKKLMDSQLTVPHGTNKNVEKLKIN